MVYDIISFIVTVAMMVSSGVASGAIAASKINIDYDSESFEQDISQGDIRVRVDYRAGESFDDRQLYYVLYYQDEAYLQGTPEYPIMRGEVRFQDIDNDERPEVIVESYTGGAHCCTVHQIYRWTGGEFEEFILGPADGGGGSFEDLDGDGDLEFLTFNGGFLYRFSSYAGSFPPSLILSLGDDGFEDVTREYPQELRSRAERMRSVVQERDYEINGVLAGYVAQKILLDEFEEGWEFMLEHYDRQEDWGLDIYNEDGDVIGQHPDFPTALRAFLVESGYLDDE
ncbi:MAG: hypothetical protein HLUCCO16_07195 [Phormidium sp. OSCR]|nr:MAG: hypothetical protein HLUCCO16_07195 [Phormidium sp. OSCR]